MKEKLCKFLFYVGYIGGILVTFICFGFFARIIFLAFNVGFNAIPF